MQQKDVCHPVMMVDEILRIKDLINMNIAT